MQVVKQYVLGSINLLILFRVNKIATEVEVTLLYLLRMGNKRVLTVKEYHLATTYKTVFNILFLGLVPYVHVIGEHHQCGFRLSRSTDGDTR
jgi:hypothetical protein